MTYKSGYAQTDPTADITNMFRLKMSIYRETERNKGYLGNNLSLKQVSLKTTVFFLFNNFLLIFSFHLIRFLSNKIEVNLRNLVRMTTRKKSIKIVEKNLV